MSAERERSEAEDALCAELDDALDAISSSRTQLEEARDELVRVMSHLSDEGWSLRMIAAAVNMSHEQVRRMLSGAA